MKAKSIILSGLLLVGAGAATTSCEDMFTAENKLVATDLTPKDTLYQVMGILERMQKLADRTVLLGEVRADLVDVNPAVASVDVQQLSNNAVELDNVYNKPADYYAVINNCNIYLDKVDSLYKSHGEYYYEKEICAVKSFRAWCYLELAKIYGEVPLVTEPILTAGAAEDIVASGVKANVETILTFCIYDLQKYPYMNENEELRPVYGGGEYNGIGFNKMFIPVRALLAELYLWRGSYTNNPSDYIDAARMYHDYFCFPGEEKSVQDWAVAWSDRDHNSLSSLYGRNHFSPSTWEGVLPCDTISYYGNTSDLRVIFNSQYSNNYYPWVVPSQTMRNISRAQDYCFYHYQSEQFRDTIYMSKDPNDYQGTMVERIGDLRFGDVYTAESNLAASKYNSDYSPTLVTIAKWMYDSSTSSDKKVAAIPYYRVTNLYLHMAEALNRAGFPETAFAVLKYGLSYDVMNNRNIISQDEFDRLCEIKSYGFFLTENSYASNEELSGKANGSIAIWRSNIFLNPDWNLGYVFGDGVPANSGYIGQIGVHSLGSGNSEYNKYYVLDDEETLAGLKPYEAVPDTVVLGRKPTEEELAAHAESKIAYEEAIAKNKEIAAENAAYLAGDDIRAKRQAHVAKLILDEEALEGAFEGLRFYDLMRYQMQDGEFNGSTITIPQHVAEKYGASDRMVGKPWYLTLPTR